MIKSGKFDDLSDGQISDTSATMFGCFAYTNEPLTIHHLQKIIIMESQLVQIDHTLDILMKNNAKEQRPKFPPVVPECLDQLDFMQKISYIDHLADSFNQIFKTKKQICQINHQILDKQLLKIFYISIQAKVARDPNYRLTQEEQKLFQQNH